MQTLLTNPELEAALLGVLLIDPDAYLRVADNLRDHHFSSTAHAAIFQAISAAALGGTINYVSVANLLEVTGKLEVAGGAVHLTEIVNDAYVALPFVQQHTQKIIALSQRRELVGVAEQMVRDAHDLGKSVADVQASAESLLLDAATHTNNAVAVSASTLAGDLLARVGAFMSGEARWNSVPTGIKPLDDCLAGGLEPGVYIIAGRASMGKCLGRGTLVMMADGTTRAVEDVHVGDKLLGPDSQPRTVLSTCTGQEPMFLIKQARSINYLATGDHVLALKRSYNEGVWHRGDKIYPTANEVSERGAAWRKRFKGYKVAVEFPEQLLPIDPYFLGLWLGDGKSTDSRIYTVDPEIVEFLYEYAYRRQEYVVVGDKNRDCKSYRITSGRGARSHQGSLRAVMGRMGLLGNKHIPHKYIANSRENRLKLLAGLVDSDGYYPKNNNGPYEITQKNERLARQIKFLCDTLGYRTSLKPKIATCQGGFRGLVWRLTFNGNVDEIPVHVPRKKAHKWVSKVDWQATSLKIEPWGDAEYFGFELEGDGLFLLEDMTVTHNSALMLQIATHIASHGKRVAFFSIEMSNREVGLRMASTLARVPLHTLKAGLTTPDQNSAVMSALGEISEWPMHLIDRSDLRAADVLLTAQRIALEHKDLAAVFVDGLWLMSADRRFNNREQELSAISKGVKQAQRHLDVPIVIAHQLSRGPEHRTDKRPMLSDLRDSGAVEQDADVVLMLYREKYYDYSDSSDEAEIWIRKNRLGGASGERVTMYWVQNIGRFERISFQEEE